MEEAVTNTETPKRDRTNDELFDVLSTQIHMIQSHLDRLDTRLDTHESIETLKAKRPVPFGNTITAWLTRLLIAVIVALQIAIGGLIAIRLGPDGYNRTQAKAQWEALCDELHHFHPDLVCPPLARESGDGSKKSTF